MSQTMTPNRTSAPVERVLRAVNNVRTSGEGWEASCPVVANHSSGDKKRHLTIGLGRNDAALVHCQKGCTTEDVLGAIGLKLRDLYANQGGDEWTPRGPAVATYSYTDENNRVLFGVCRTVDKEFAQWRPDETSKSGRRWRLDGVRRVLYRLPEVRRCAETGGVLYITEGERDTDRLRSLGLTATTNPMGAKKWRADFTEQLKGISEAVILEDLDSDGHAHAGMVAASVLTVASVKVIALPELRPKGDISDWLDAGHTLDELKGIVSQAEPWADRGAHDRPFSNPPLTHRQAEGFSAAALMDMDFPEPKWAVQGFLPEGLSLLAGKPKIGKSWLSLGCAVAVAAGGTALGKVPVEGGEVLCLALEDTARRLKKRLAMVLQGEGAPTGLHFETRWPTFDEDGLKRIDQWLADHPGARLVVVDTLQKVRPKSTGRQTLYSDDYAALTGLKELADRHGVAVLVIHHLRKSGSEDPLETVSGTTGLTGAADAVLVIQRDRARASAVLYVTGRDVEDTEVALEFDRMTGMWNLLGDAEEYRRSEERQEIVRVFQHVDEPMGPKDVEARLGEPWTYPRVKWLLAEMVKSGELLRVGRGSYTVPISLSTTPNHTNQLTKPTLRTAPTTPTTQTTPTNHAKVGGPLSVTNLSPTKESGGVQLNGSAGGVIGAEGRSASHALGGRDR